MDLFSTTYTEDWSLITMHQNLPRIASHAPLRHLKKQFKS